MGDIYDVLPALLSAIEVRARSMAGAFLADGEWLLNALTVVVLAWTAIKTLLEQGEMTDSVSELIHTLMAWGFAAWILRNYDGFTHPLLDTFNDIAWRIAGMPAPEGNSDADARTMYAGLSAFMKVVNQITAAMSAIWSGLKWYQIVGNLQPIAAGIVILGATAVIMFLAAGIYCVVYASSAVLLAIGIGLGPLFIPWFVFRPTRGLFEGWIRFLAQAGLYKIVGAVLVSLTAPMIGRLSEFMEQLSKSGQSDLAVQSAVFNASLVGGSAMICLMAILIAGMMAMAPSIAAALMGSALTAAGAMPMPKGPRVGASGTAVHDGKSSPAGRSGPR